MPVVPIALQLQGQLFDTYTHNPLFFSPQDRNCTVKIPSTLTQET